MSSYITSTKMYNTGYLSTDTDNIRIKQGLDPQSVANVCYYTDTSYVDLSKNLPYQCNQETLNPIPQARLSYELPPIDPTCPCLDYTRAP